MFFNRACVHHRHSKRGDPIAPDRPFHWMEIYSKYIENKPFALSLSKGCSSLQG
jgi:hypothetical protein